MFGAPPTQPWHQDHMGGGGTHLSNHWGHPLLAHGALCRRSARGPPRIGDYSKRMIGNTINITCMRLPSVPCELRQRHEANQLHLIIARVQAPSRINTAINNASESAHPAQDGAITTARRTPCADAPALRAAGKNEAHKNETHEKILVPLPPNRGTRTTWAEAARSIAIIGGTRY